jgi:protein SCO1
MKRYEMKHQNVFPLVLFLLTGNAVPVSAHSLDSLEDKLNETEVYFQPLDRDAPDFTLQDADGQTVGSTDLLGKVVVLHFIYTSCPDVCPLHAERIAEIQTMINATPMRDLVQFVTITTDPKNDTPDVMHEYGSIHGLDATNWTFLTSGQDRLGETRELVENFGHTFSETEDGYQVHGVVTHVIDMEGRWRANFHGLEFQPTNLVLFINALTNDVHRENEDEQPSLWETFMNLF